MMDMSSMEGNLGVRKGAWTREEDNLLRKCVEIYGEQQWHQVPNRAGLNRCRKSCRLRWLNYLKPNIKRGEFTEDEVDMILRLHKLLGNRQVQWSLIAGRLPGRTANDVKNYWNTNLRKKAVSSKKDWKAMKTSSTSTQNTQKINVIKPQPRSFTKNMSLVWTNTKTAMEENSKELCKKKTTTTSSSSSNNEIMWWERLLEDIGEFVQDQTPTFMGWSDNGTNFCAEKSPEGTSTFFNQVDQPCLDFDADLWNILTTEEANAI
ncbi:hypothetical protein ACOSQ4_026591 [Xanthoceras sorbifolium]